MRTVGVPSVGAIRHNGYPDAVLCAYMATAPTLLLIVDGSSLLHRAYHALPSLTAPDGRLVNAAYGFLTMFFKALAELAPTHVAVTFDLPGGTFRNDLFPAYQAQREEKPNELYAQIPIIKGLLDALHVPVIEVEGYEADDAIGTIVERITDDGLRITGTERKRRQARDPKSQIRHPRIIVLTRGDAVDARPELFEAVLEVRDYAGGGSAALRPAAAGAGRMILRVPVRPPRTRAPRV